MIALEKKYQNNLLAIKDAIQNSELLAQYLEEEDEEFYSKLKDEYEEQIADLHNEVAEKDPLQLVSLENNICDLDLEGLFLPRNIGL